MRRRARYAELDSGDALPVELARFVPADWPGSSTAEQRQDREMGAGSHPATAANVVAAMMDRHRRRRQWNDARAAWCAERHMLDASGIRPDWHRLNAVARAVLERD